MRFKDLPIRRKLIQLIFMISVSVLVLAGAVMLVYEFRNSRREMAGKLSAMAEIISANSAAVLVFDDPKLAREILSGLDAEPEVTAAALYDKDGKLFAQYPTNLVASQFPAAPSGNDGATFHLDHFALFMPVVQGDRRVGTLFLKADYRQMYERVRVYGITLLIVLSGSTLLALFLSNLFEWRISRPLLELADLAKTVSEKKDYSVRAVKTSEDELGYLTDAFNSMLTQIQASDAAIRHLADIVEYSQDAIISKTLQGIILSWNRGAEHLFGYTAAEVVGKPITVLIPTERQAEEEMILERQRRGEAIEHFETVRVRKDGKRIEVSLSISPLRDSKGTIIGASKIARDITDKKRAEREMERARDAAEAANRAKDDFLAALSHELRTPLLPVMITISMLQKDHSLPANLRDSLNIVRRNIEIQSRMINDLLDLSRIRANKLELALTQTDVHEIIRRALEVCSSHKRFPELDVVMELEATQHFVLGDADRLQQVFWNLIQNSIKFTPPGGKITITSRNDEDILCVSIADTGCGIEAELLPKIFEPFEQGGRKGRESLQGLGLGLAIAKRIIAAHGGTLVAASEGKDSGAVFTVELQAIPAGLAGEVPGPNQSELLTPKL